MGFGSGHSSFPPSPLTGEGEGEGDRWNLQSSIENIVTEKHF